MGGDILSKYCHSNITICCWLYYATTILLDNNLPSLDFVLVCIATALTSHAPGIYIQDMIAMTGLCSSLQACKYDYLSGLA